MINGLPSAAGYTASDMINPAIEVGSRRDEVGDECDQRRARARAIDDVKRGRFQHLVDELLSEKYHTKTYTEMKLQSGISARINIMQDAIDKYTRAVWSDANWELLPTSGEQALDSAQFKQWMSAAEPNALAGRIVGNILAHEGYLVLPCVYTVERAGERRLGWRCYSPAHFDLEGGDHADDWDALLIYEDPEHRNAPAERYRITAETVEEQRKMHDGRWVTLESKPNKYGMILGEVFRLDPSHRWSPNYGVMLLQSTLEANAAQSLMSRNSAGQIKMLSGYMEGASKGVRGVHGGFIDTPASGAGVSVLDLTVDQKAFREANIEAERRMCAVALGLPADEFESTTVPPSGESLKLRYFGMTLRAREMRRVIIPGLQRLYWQSLHVLRTDLTSPPEDDEPVYPIAGFPDVSALPPHEVGKSMLDQPVRLSIDVVDMTIPETEAERQTRIKFDVESGFTTLPKVMAQENPDIDDAAQAMQDNLKASALIRADEAMSIDKVGLQVAYLSNALVNATDPKLNAVLSAAIVKVITPLLGEEEASKVIASASKIKRPAVADMMQKKRVAEGEK